MIYKEISMEEYRCLNGHGVGYKICYNDGTLQWVFSGKLHRKDGPALIVPGGYESWYLNGCRHRVDGPAVVFADYMNDSWHLYGLEYSKEEWFSLLTEEQLAIALANPENF